MSFFNVFVTIKDGVVQEFMGDAENYCCSEDIGEGTRGRRTIIVRSERVVDAHYWIG